MQLRPVAQRPRPQPEEAGSPWKQRRIRWNTEHAEHSLSNEGTTLARWGDCEPAQLCRNQTGDGQKFSTGALFA